MKHLSITGMVCVLIAAAGISCSKQVVDNTTQGTGLTRKIQFSLYTDKDFSNDNSNISFRLFINDATDKLLWDSTLNPIKAKDIPDLAHKLVIEKNISGNNASLLKVGFYYTIENVGYSWHIDSCRADESFKAVNFNFR